jgi:hypothetical protein
MVRMPGAARDHVHRPDRLARPDLVDPQERQVVGDRVAPPPSTVSKRVMQPGLEQVKHGIALGCIEIATDDQRHRYGHGTETADDRAKLLPTLLSVRLLLAPAVRRPEVQAEHGGNEPGTDHLDFRPGPKSDPRLHEV